MADSQQTVLIILLCLVAGFLIVNTLMKKKPPPPGEADPNQEAYFHKLLATGPNPGEDAIRYGLTTRAREICQEIEGTPQDRVEILYTRLALLFEAYDYYARKHGWPKLNVTVARSEVQNT